MAKIDPYVPPTSKNAPARMMNQLHVEASMYSQDLLLGWFLLSYSHIQPYMMMARNVPNKAPMSPRRPDVRGWGKDNGTVGKSSEKTDH